MIVVTQQEKKEVKKKKGFPKLMKNTQFGFIILATEEDSENNTTGIILSDPSTVEPIYRPGHMSCFFTSDALEDYNEELILSNK